ncbi:hypothetical protein PR048_014887, partial [Dryococelus australis]
MQSEKPKLFLLYDRIPAVYQCILQCYIKQDYLARTPVEEIQYRSPSNYVSLNEVFLGAKVVATISSDQTIGSAKELIRYMKDSHSLDVDNQWHLLMQTDLDFEPIVTVENFWAKINKIKRGDESIVFKNSTSLVKKLLALPSTSAAVESVFSACKLILSDSRNKLNTKSVSGLLHAKRDIKICHEFKVGKEHKALFNKSMYDCKGDEDKRHSSSEDLI